MAIHREVDPQAGLRPGYQHSPFDIQSSSPQPGWVYFYERISPGGVTRTKCYETQDDEIFHVTCRVCHEVVAQCLDLKDAEINLLVWLRTPGEHEKCIAVLNETYRPKRKEA